jgi:hypothetical protein
MEFIRRIDKVSVALFTLMLLFLGGCKPTGGGAASILSPVSGRVYEAPPTLSISYQTRPSVIQLNGAGVGHLFTFNGTAATADSGDFVSYLREGSNEFQLNPPLGPKVTFTYDSQGPMVVIDRVEGSNPIHITGKLIDPSGPAGLMVNDVGASLGAGGTFDILVDDADKYHFVASDSGGKTTETIFAAPGQEFDRIITTRVSQSGLDFIAAEMAPILQDINTTPMLPDVNRELKEALEKDLALVAAFADVKITALKWAAIELDLDLKADAEKGKIGFDADLYNILVDLQVDAILGISIPATAYISYAKATGDADVYGESGRLGVDVTGLSLETEGIDVNLAGYDTVIISALANLLMPALQDVVSTFVNGIVEGVLDQELEEMGDEVIVDLDGYQLGMKPLFQDFSSDDESLHVVLGGAMMAKTYDTGVPQVLGSLYSEDALPDATDPASHIYAHVSSNMINQALMVSFQTGLNHFALINRSDLLVGTADRGDDKPLGTERIMITPNAPAFFAITDVAGDPSVTFGLNGMKLAMQKMGSSGYRDLFTTEIDLEARVVLAVNDDDSLRIDFAGAPELSLRDTRILDLINVNERLIDTIMDLVMPKILPKIAEATRSIEIPRFAGYQLSVDDFAAVGDEDSHLGVGITLSNPGAVVCAEGLERFGSQCYEQCNEGFVGIGKICWSPRKQTYGRGVGTIPSLTCGAEELDAGLCYEHCEPGYDGVGPVCWLEDASYGRGVGRPLKSWCSGGKEEDAGLCYTPCKAGFHGIGPVCWNDLPNSYGRGVGTIPNLIPYECRGGKEMDAGLCYTPCRSGYHGVGPVCWGNEGSYGRGVGTPMTFGCYDNEDEDAGLCYDQCADGYHGVGPVCWSDRSLSYGRGVGTPAAQVCDDNEEKDAGLCYTNCEFGYNGVGPVCWAQGIEPYDRIPVSSP